MIFDVEEIYKETDIFIIPSKAEAFSRAIIESMSFGNWVIATNVGGAKELITNFQNGFLIEHSVDALSKSIKECINKIRIDGNYNEKGKVAVNNICNPDNCFEQLSNIYVNAIK